MQRALPSDAYKVEVRDNQRTGEIGVIGERTCSLVRVDDGDEQTIPTFNVEYHLFPLLNAGRHLYPSFIK